MNIKLLIEHHLEFLNLKKGCTGSYESTLVKMPHCWKFHVTAQLYPFKTQTDLKVLKSIIDANYESRMFERANSEYIFAASRNMKLKEIWICKLTAFKA